MRARTRLRASLTQCTGQWYACQGKKPRPLSYQTFAHSLKEEMKLQKVTLWTSLIAIYLYSIPQFLLLPVLLFVLDSTGKRLFLVLGRPLSSFDNTIDAIGPDLRFNLGMVVKETRGNRLFFLYPRSQLSLIRLIFFLKIPSCLERQQPERECIKSYDSGVKLSGEVSRLDN